MIDLVRRIASPARRGAPAALDLSQEWLVTNGLGGYASGTVLGALTRRFHGCLIAALPAPLGRMMMLNAVIERVQVPGGEALELGADEREGTGLAPNGSAMLAEFRLEAGLPVWRYEIGAAQLEKRVLMPHGQNTVLISYRFVAGPGKARLELRPALQIRPHEGNLGEAWPDPYQLSVVHDRYEVRAPSPGLPPLRLRIADRRAPFTCDEEVRDGLMYRVEQSRGYECRGHLWSPGAFSVELAHGDQVTLVASTETWEIVQALRPDEAFAAERERRRRLLEGPDGALPEATTMELMLAADQFLITPAGRVEDTARARAAGDDVRTVIAGYHWFTDWGRDTMISLEGLTLVTRRHAEARYILRTFAHYVRDGLIPNMFPEGEKDGLYHTADASLWFFHAIDRYLHATGDRATLRLILPTLLEIADHHLKGTRFGIRVDPADGLLTQGAEGYQLTWMDAKVGDWVVTPRRGKAVEINALWYNALSLIARWLGEEQGDAAARPFAEHADRARAAFNARFWYAEGRYLYDVVDGEQGGPDARCRPNQVFAIALPHAVVDPARWEPVMHVVAERLLTPVGLRSLAPGEPDFVTRYDGDLHARDAAYHQGTVWAWLIGPFVDAWLKVHPEDRAGARRLLEGLVPHLDEACIGSVSEVFDAADPFTPRGCVAQAWSVAELLRCWVATAPERNARPR